MKIDLAQFGGLAPKIEARRLADHLATEALNTGFESGALAPVNIGGVESTEFPFRSASAQSVMRPGATATRLILTQAVSGEPFASLLAPNDAWDRIYFNTANGPRFTAQGNYVEEGVNLDPVSYPLGIKGPTLAPAMGSPQYTAPAGVTADLVFVGYVFTFVDKYGHESAPSPASGLTQIPTNTPFTHTITFPAETPTGINTDGAKRYIYRAGFDGNTSAYQWVGEAALAASTWVDTVPFGSENEELVSTNWVPPPSGLKAMTPVAAGFIAGYHDHYLCYSEPYLPHAWPENYRYPLKYPIVGLKHTQGGLLITTKGKPYWAYGTDPLSAAPRELDAYYPCLSAESMVDMGGYVMYATQDGLVAINESEQRVVTAELVDRHVWLRDFAPAQIRAFIYEGLYVFGSTDVWWAFEPGSGNLVKFDTAVLPVLPSQLRQAYYDTPRDTTVLVATSGRCYDVVAQQGTRFKWRSRTFEVQPISFACAQVLATQYPVTMRVIADGQTREYSIAGENPIRLHSGFRASRWALELEGQGRVTRAVIALSPGDVR